ncbi:SH3 type 3 domain protein [Devosia sp. LC5]|uniref:SH3 domain-containing protein n=1 Tax=Devosia sp. LC5 TaxID=1502724 RepID=UPI0004E3A99B|nr:SH3 domain-containing protein [Devosia sp. LC5]KFC66954.1 SH3 type 3 domain protein [Devosia sp. LC5]
MKSFRLAIFTAMAALASVGAALAAPATVTTNVNVRSGPSQQTAVLDVLQAGTRIDAQCDSSGWCRVSYGRASGWVSAAYVAIGGPAIQPPRPQPQPVPGNGGGWFPGNPGPGPGNGGGWNPGPGNGGWNPGWPQPPRPQPQPPRPPQPPVYEDAGACFYSERNMRGRSFCLDQGETMDSLPRGWNDAIRSVEVFGGARVDLCSDQFQYGACVTLRSDTPRLRGQIDSQASSIDVY